MKAVVNWLLDKIIVPILLMVLAPIVTSIGSKVSTGNWFEWFATTSVLVWVILAIIFVPWIVFAIHRRIKHLRKEDWSPVSLRFAPSGGWRTIDTIKYAGVIWNIRVPVINYTFKRKEVLTSHDLDIETPPRCPNCGTELEQVHSFWGWYVWKCVGCGFRKHNRESYYKEEERVKKIAKRQFEMHQSQTGDRQ